MHEEWNDGVAVLFMLGVEMGVPMKSLEVRAWRQKDPLNLYFLWS